MDQGRFDSLTRSLATAKTRRGLLGSLAALGAGLFGARAADAQQVTQSFCGNVVCNGNGCACKPGCACCVYGNGNSRCRPPGECGSGTPVACPPPTTTTAPPTTTTTAAPSTTTTTTTTTTTAPPACASLPEGSPCGTAGVCLDGACQELSGGCTTATRCISIVDCPSGCSAVSFCDQTAEGAYVCIDYTEITTCQVAGTCATTADCDPGHVCIPDKCFCSICVPVCGSGATTAASARFASEAVGGVNPGGDR